MRQNARHLHQVVVLPDLRMHKAGKAPPAAGFPELQGLPRQPLQFWKTSGGRGFTCFVHPQIWQNDHLMEVAGILPHGAATACDNGTKKKG